MKEKILSLLKEAPGELSGEELSRTLGVSRAAVWKAIEQLRRDTHTKHNRRNPKSGDH